MSDAPPKLSFLDRLAREIAPGIALERLEHKRRFDAQSATVTNWGAYDGAVSTRRRHHPPFLTSFERDEDRSMGDYERRALRLIIREMRRNLGLVFGALNRFANGVVGTGLTPLPKTRDKEWNNAAAHFWTQYQKVCDYRQRLHGWEIQRLIVKARMADGEGALALIDNGQVQPIEGERIATPTAKKAEENEKILQGFRLTREGIPLGVFVCGRDASGHVDRKNYEYIRMDNLLYAAVVERFDALRGVPSLASVTNYFRDKGEFTAATLFKAKLDAFMGWAVQSDEDVQASNVADRTAAQTETGNDVRVEKHDQGEIWYLPRDSEIKSLASTTPNQQHDSFTKNIMREISMSLDIPSEVLMMNLGEASFSGGRGIMMLAYNTWRIWRYWLVNEAIQPWWNWRIAKAIKEQDIPPAPVDEAGVSEWYKVNWQPPEETWLDPRGEAAANKAEVELGTNSVARICLGRGTTEDQLFDEKESSIANALTRAARLNTQYPGAGVSWRDITNPSTPGAQQGKPAGEEENEDRKRDEKKSEGMT